MKMTAGLVSRTWLLEETAIILVGPLPFSLSRHNVDIILSNIINPKSMKRNSIFWWPKSQSAEFYCGLWNWMRLRPEMGYQLALRAAEVYVVISLGKAR